MSYEFTTEQNNLLSSLASKMGLVGMLAVVVGALNLISSLLLLVFIFQDQLPPEVLDKIPAEARADLPPMEYLWGLLVQGTAVGVIFLMTGIWTRAAAASFREVATTEGRDVPHLMNGLGSLHKMYALMSTLIIAATLIFVIGMLLQLLIRYGG